MPVEENFDSGYPMSIKIKVGGSDMCRMGEGQAVP